MKGLFLIAAALGLAAPVFAKGRPAAPALEKAFAVRPAPPPRAGLPVENPIVIDPGHGGEDLGAVVAGRQEKDIALAIARKLKARLGAFAALTRDSDVYVPLDERINESLRLRGAAFVSLHLNQVRRKSLQGITVYAYGRSPFHILRRLFHRHSVPPLPSPPKEEIQSSTVLAQSVVRSFRSAGLNVEPIARADYYVLKNPRIPSILIELGYLSNPKEAARLADPAYQDRLVDALAKSLSGYALAASAKAPKTLALRSSVKPASN